MRFLVVAIVCVTWCAVGFIMAFRHDLYRKWAEWSWTGRHLPRLTERWLQQRRSCQVLGILFMAFGAFAFIGFLLLMR
jgi:ammonia channel protein AmtB